MTHQLFAVALLGKARTTKATQLFFSRRSPIPERSMHLMSGRRPPASYGGLPHASSHETRHAQARASAPSLASNADGELDPEMHQTKKGDEWTLRHEVAHRCR